MSVDKFIKVQKQGDIYYYKCPNNTMSGQSCFISMRSNLNRELYYALPSDAVLVDCNEATTTVTTTQPTTTLPCDIQFQSLGFVDNASFPYDYVLSKGYIQVVMTTLSRNPSYQFQILSGTTVVMDWTDPISTFNTFYFKVNCANYTVKARDFYNQSCVININNISVPCLIQPTTTTNSSCNNGSTPFNIITTSYSNNQLTYVYDAQNLVNATWVIRTGSQILFNGTVTHTSSSNILTNVPLPNGNYTFELIGTSCVGTATKNFSVTDSTTTTIPTTIQSCNPNGGVFSIISVAYNNVTNEINYIYDASNLVDATWQITSNTNVIQTGSVRHLSSNITIPLVSPLPNGTYNFNLTGVTCSGTASKSFGVTTTTTSTTTTTVPTTTSSTTTSTTTTTTTVPTWNPCSVYSLESKYVDSTVSGRPNRETKVLINNYNQFTNTYLYYGEILLTSSLDYTNNGFTTASYYKFISSTSLNNVGYTLLYDPNVSHDYVVTSYSLSTKTVIESKTLNFNNRGIINTYPNKSEILAITIDNNGNLYCSSKFGIDKYAISGSNWGFVKNVTPSSYNISLASSTATDLPFNDGYNAIMASMNYIPNLDAIVWSFGGDFVILCNVDGSGKVVTLFTSFSTTTLSTFVKDNFLYFSRVLEYDSSTDRNFYNYTAPNDIPRSSLIGKLDINDVSKNDLTHVSIPLPNPFDNLPMQFYNTMSPTNKIADFVQSMACKNLYIQNQFTISEPMLVCYPTTITASFIIYGGSSNYEISIDGGASWTHYSATKVTLTLSRTSHITNLGYDVYLVKIKDNDTNIIHHFYIPNTTNCQ